MANSFQKLADILNIETARLSGDPRRLQVASQMQEQKELKQATAQSEAEINKAIDESNLPESQKRLLKALSLREKAALFLETQKPEKEKTIADYKAYLAKKYASGEKLSAEDLQLEAFIQNLDVFERRTRGIPGGSQSVAKGTKDNPVEITSLDEAEKYPKGSYVKFNNNVIIVD